jgi:hypothetical protein
MYQRRQAAGSTIKNKKPWQTKIRYDSKGRELSLVALRLAVSQRKVRGIERPGRRMPGDLQAVPQNDRRVTVNYAIRSVSNSSGPVLPRARVERCLRYC